MAAGVSKFVKQVLELDTSVVSSKDACRSFEAGILARLGVGDGDKDDAPVYRPASDADHAANRRLVARFRTVAPVVQAVYPVAKFLATFREVARPLSAKIEKLTEQCSELDGDRELSTSFKLVQVRNEALCVVRIIILSPLDVNGNRVGGSHGQP